MRRLFFLMASLLVAGKSFALPPCPSSGYFDNCYGSYQVSNGGKYVGEWRDGEMHGQGTATWANGSKYVGEWRDGKMTGHGTLTYDNGEKYVGEWRGNKRHGQGTYTFANGNKYVGEWRYDKRTGHGTFTFANGEKFFGEHRENDFWEGSGYSKSGQVLGTHSFGQWCDGCTPTAKQLALAQQAQSVARAIALNRELSGTGTGFVVARDYLVTAEHVVEGCSAVTIVSRYGEQDAQTVALDRRSDLALLRFQGGANSIASIRQSQLRIGEAAINFGFPLAGILAARPQITAGHVSSLVGLENDDAFLQYSAPTQFGNSGGPVLDAYGNVIGVVSSKLNDAKTQNVNFATKYSFLESFLMANGVPFRTGASRKELKLPDIAEKAETFTVLVGCWE